MNKEIVSNNREDEPLIFISDRAINLYNDNKILKARIDKAIQYIENNWIEYSDFQYVDNDDELNIDCESIKELLDILKGGEENEK